MSTSENDTIPIRTSTPPVIANPTETLNSKKPSVWRNLRFIQTAFYLTVLVAVSWGCWCVVSLVRNTEKPNATAELDAFESAPAFPFVPKPDEAGPSNPADVWLTGTIEVEAATPSLASEPSLRISGSPNDPSTIR